MKWRIQAISKKFKHWIQLKVCKIRHGACLSCVEWYVDCDSILKEQNKKIRELKKLLRKGKNEVWN
ncbi:hypothetical protein [Mycoplasma sp. Z1473D]